MENIVNNLLNLPFLFYIFDNFFIHTWVTGTIKILFYSQLLYISMDIFLLIQ